MSEMAILIGSLDGLDGAERARLEWLLAALRPGSPSLDLVQAGEAFDESMAARVPAMARFLSRRSVRLGAHRVVDVAREPAGVIEVRLRDESLRLWALRVRLSVNPPHRIQMLTIARPFPAGTVVREADEGDGPTIERIEAGSGVEHADGTRATMMLGARLIEQARMMEGGRVFIVEIDGEPAACDAYAVRRVRHGSRTARLLYRHHTRVLPAFRRLGLNEALATRMAEVDQTERLSDASAVHIDPNNSVIKEWSGIPPWKTRPFRAFLPCAALAGPRAGRPATSADAAFASQCINALHEREALFLPYDSATLGERLSRRPHTYGWPQLLVGDGAVLGVWNAVERMTMESAATRGEWSRAFVLDYGFQPAAGPGELERLIRSCCSRLHREGVTHLSIFCCRGSPAEMLIRSLADRVVDVEFQSGLPEPDDTERFGVYVDHLYF